jgi:hypothetical protein
MVQWTLSNEDISYMNFQNISSFGHYFRILMMLFSKLKTIFMIYSQFF